jgi:hypothetical protein
MRRTKISPAHIGSAFFTAKFSADNTNSHPGILRMQIAEHFAGFRKQSTAVRTEIAVSCYFFTAMRTIYKF